MTSLVLTRLDRKRKPSLSFRYIPAQATLMMNSAARLVLKVAARPRDSTPPSAALVEGKAAN